MELIQACQTEQQCNQPEICRETGGCERVEDEEHVQELIDAASAVIARWDAPLWKDIPHTATYIRRLRLAVSAMPRRNAVK